jgi:hypothetical protein
MRRAGLSAPPPRRYRPPVRARQVGVVAQDRVAAELVPEARDARLARQHRVRVVGSVRARAREDPVDRERELHHPSVLAVGTLGRDSHRHEAGARGHDQHERRERDHGAARPRARSGGGERGVGERQQHAERREREGDRVAVEGAARRRQDRPEPRRSGLQPLVVREPPGEAPRRVVAREVARHEQQQPGNHRDVEPEAALARQLCGSPGGATGRRAPQEHTTLLTAHSILRKRPQLWQPR